MKRRTFFGSVLGCFAWPWRKHAVVAVPSSPRTDKNADIIDPRGVTFSPKLTAKQREAIIRMINEYWRGPK